MFELNLGTILFLYVFLTIGVFFVFWLVFEHKSYANKRSRQKEENIWKCFICGTTYIDSKTPDFTKCPECGSINTREDQKKEG